MTLSSKNTNQSGKLSLATKIGYGVGTLCDSLPANLYNIFFLVFAINFVGLDPAFAGIISAVAVLWDAITDPIVGYISDKLNSSGRLSRQQVMIRAIGPLTVSLIFLYYIVDASIGYQNIYYTVLALTFWTFYTVFIIPYAALGAEMTSDYDERSSLRFYAHIFTMLGLLIASSFTMMFVERFLAQGNSPQKAWLTLSLTYGAIVLASGIICWISVSKIKLSVREQSERSMDNIFKVIFSTLKNKSIRTVCLAIFCYAVGFTLAQGTLIFFMEKVLGFTGADIGKYFMLTAIIGIATIPILNYAVKMLGKRRAYTLLIICIGLLQMSFKFIGVSNFTWMLIFGIIQGFGHSVFFPMSYALAYDCCDIDTYITGEKREGTILSITGLMQKIGYAIGTSLAGILLSFFGYNASLATQSAETMNGIGTTMFIIAPAFFILSAILMKLFKINRDNYSALQSALELMKKGEKPEPKGFEELL